MALGRQRLAGLALLGCVCFIAYQSLAAGGVWRCDGPLLHMPARVSRADLLVNVAGYMPLGFLGVVMLAARRRAMATVGAVSATCAFGTALSLGLEAVQACQAARVSSLADVFANAAGTAAGAFVAAVLGAVVPRLFDDAGQRWRRQRLPIVTLAVPALWILSQTLPWVFSLDVGVVRANLSFLRRLHGDLLIDAWPLARHMTAWLAIGCAWRLVTVQRGWTVSGFAAIVACAIGLQALTQSSRPLSFSELAGMALAFSVLVPGMLVSATRTHARAWAIALAVCATVSIAAYELEPGTRGSRQAFQLLPQVGLSRPLDLLDFALLFGWFGVAITAAAHWYEPADATRSRRWWPVLAVVVAVAFEVMQLGIAGRGPDLSPPLLTALAVLVTTVVLRDER